jgi:hypothetical protein
MSTISATFQNNTDGRFLFVVQDLGSTPPQTLFNDFLNPNDSTPPLSLFSSDGIFGKAQYQRAGGPIQIVDDITEGTVVPMN